jgi:hypothetical protein
MTKNFDTEKMFDEYSKTVRTWTTMIYPTEFRFLIEKTVDLQVETGKYFTKAIADTFTKYVPAK